MSSKTVLLFFLSFGLTTGMFAQTTRPGSSQQNLSGKQMVDQAILAIRKNVQEINSKKLKKEHYTYEISCVDGGVADYYFDGKAIVKIVESGSKGDGTWVNEYYYQSGKFIFCFSSDVGGPAIGEVVKSEHRFYVKDNRLIKVMEGKKTIEGEPSWNEVIERAYKLIKANSSKDFETALCTYN